MSSTRPLPTLAALLALAVPAAAQDAAPAPRPADSFLRYDLPDALRSPRARQTLLFVGAGLILTDRNTIRLFDVHRGDTDRHVDRTYRTFNFLADGATLGLGLGGVWALSRGATRDTAATALTALANATVATTLIKGLVGKERPDEAGEPHYRGPSLTYSSFPSGHTAAATSVAHVLAVRHPRQKALWYGFAAAVAFSRVSSSKHWVSDTFWGAGLGLFSAEGALRGQSAGLRLRF